MRIVLAVFFLSGLVGCSSLLYFPSTDAFTDPAQFNYKPEQIDFLSEDGMKLHGWYFKSLVRPAKATLLFFHGNAQNITTHFYSLYWILEKGYDYFIFDYRGYGQSDGVPTPEGTLKDGRAALKWLNQHKDSGSKLVIFAQSLGSAVALRVACEAKSLSATSADLPSSSALDSAHYDAVIVDSGFVSYRRAAQKVLSHSWLTWPFQWLAHLVLSDEFAPGECVNKISPHPLLVIHGDHDQTIDFSLGQKLFELSSDPKDFWRVEGGRHTDFVYREKFRYRQLLLNWLDQTLGMSSD